MKNLNKEIQRLEQGDSWEESDEVVQIKVKKPLDKVIPIRLPSEKWEQLRREAKELGIGPTTLARMWILKNLQIKVEKIDNTGETNTYRQTNPSGHMTGKKLGARNNQFVAERGKNRYSHANTHVSGSGKAHNGSGKTV